MAGVRLDPQGRLLEMYALPPRYDPNEISASPGDWYTALFKAAGLDYKQFKDSRATPEWNPPCACDERLAWAGAAADHPDVPLRVEAAAYRGRPVYFQVISPLTKDPYRTDEPGSVLVIAFAMGQLTIAVLLGVRNLWRRRVDWRGAGRLSGAVWIGTVAVWLLAGHHNASFQAEFIGYIAVVGIGSSLALICFLYYVALEPAVRRRWPWQFTAWNRLLDGRWRDPMIGRDLLAGLVCGSAFYAFARGTRLLCLWVGYPSFLPLDQSMPQALTEPLYTCLMVQLTTVIRPLGILIVGLFFNLLLRRSWVTWVALAAVFILLLTGSQITELTYSAVILAVEVTVGVSAIVVMLSRFGLLATATFFFGLNLLIGFPLTLDTSAWYFWQGFCAAAVVLALATFGFVTATRGQRLFAGGFLGDD
jgi:hypothetical protein